SHNFAMVFSLMAIYLVLYDCYKPPFIKIAICLFLAYLCRPTLFLLSPCLLLFMFTYNKRSTIACASALLSMLCFFISFSYKEFNSFLPPYYLSSRLSNDDFLQALTAQLISPARGLLI